MRVGLYSITYLGVWYRGRALTLEELIRRAKDFGYHGIEIDGKRPHGNPLDLPLDRCSRLRALAAEHGIEIYAVAANNDFSSPVPEHRESQIAYVRELIRMTGALGVRLLRVFAAWPGITIHNGVGTYEIARQQWHQMHQKFPREQTWEWCRQGLAECARYAQEEGIVLALQNHPPVIDTHRDMLRMIGEIASPSLRACLDAPLVAKYEQTSMAEAVRAVGSLQVLSHFGGEYDNGPEPFYEDFVRALASIDYSGYIGYELCHPLPVVNGQTVEIDFVDRNARLAADFMRKLSARYPRAHPATETGGW